MARVLCSILLMSFCCASSLFAAPTIADVSLRGLRSGATSTLTIRGSELDGAPQLLLPFPVAKAELKPGGNAGQFQVDVTLDANAAPGIYPLRVANERGVSNAVLLAVDALPQAPFAAEVTALPVALHGSINGAMVLATTIEGQAGQRIVIDLECRRLGSVTDPVLELYKPDGSQLAYSPARRILGGDARLDVTLPVAGKYTIKFHDALFRGGNPGAFRLKLGALEYADLAFPLGAKRGEKTAFSFASTNLPADLRSEAALEGPLPVQGAAWPSGRLVSGPRPRVMVSDLTEVAESAESPGTPQQLTVPVGVSGRLGAPGEQDRYKLAVQPGMKLRFDVLASRLGVPLDGVLSVLREDGGQIATNDDRPNTVDPGLDVTVPDGVTNLIVALSDQQRRGSPDSLYHIAVTRIEQGDFQLTLTSDAIQIPQAGTVLVRVKAQREGYNGDIKLSFLPTLAAGTAVAGDVIPAGASDAFLTISGGSAAPGAVVGHLIGEGTVDSSTIRRLATVPETPSNNWQPWLKRDVAVAVTTAGTLQAAWQPAPDTSFTIGKNYAMQVKVTRAGGVMGDVRLSLLTTQNVPLHTEGNDKGKPNVAKAIRVDGTPSIAAAAAEGAVNIIVPPDLPEMPYDMVLQAELLSADGKQVVATAVTPVQRVTPVKPAM